MRTQNKKFRGLSIMTIQTITNKATTLAKDLIKEIAEMGKKLEIAITRAVTAEERLEKAKDHFKQQKAEKEALEAENIALNERVKALEAQLEAQAQTLREEELQGIEEQLDIIEIIVNELKIQNGTETPAENKKLDDVMGKINNSIKEIGKINQPDVVTPEEREEFIKIINTPDAPVSFSSSKEAVEIEIKESTPEEQAIVNELLKITPDAPEETPEVKVSRKQLYYDVVETLEKEFIFPELTDKYDIQTESYIVTASFFLNQFTKDAKAAGDTRDVEVIAEEYLNEWYNTIAIKQIDKDVFENFKVEVIEDMTRPF
jgi:hypothetical protein